MSKSIKLTPDRIDRIPFAKRAGEKVFLWDSHTNGLGVVATVKKKNYVYQGCFNNKTLRVIIGRVNW